ncbi:MAG: hypothetical protein WBZ29_12490 [Methanocella sp.]
MKKDLLVSVTVPGSTDAAHRGRGRPELPEEERKTRATFSITKKMLDDFFKAVEFNHDDQNRVVEAFMAQYVEKQESKDALMKRREELLQRLDETKKKINVLDSKIKFVK